MRWAALWGVMMSDLLNKAAQLFLEELQKTATIQLERWRLRVIPTLRNDQPQTPLYRGEDGQITSTKAERTDNHQK